MIDAIRYEWVRLRTIRSTWWLTGGAFVVGIGIALLLSWVTHHEFGDTPPIGSDLDGLGAFIVTQLAASGEIPSLVGFIGAIVGIFAWGHEYRHGMIRASLTTLSSRTSLWVAKYVVVGLWVVGLQLVTMLVSGLIGTAFLHSYLTVFSGNTFSVMGWQLLSTLMLTWLAMAFTQVTRSQAFALVAIFIWPLLIETLINLIFVLTPGLRDHRDVLRFLPFSAQRRMTDALGTATSTFGDPLSPLGGALVFGLLTAVLMTVGIILFRRRDA